MIYELVMLLLNLTIFVLQPLIILSDCIISLSSLILMFYCYQLNHMNINPRISSLFV